MSPKVLGFSPGRAYWVIWNGDVHRRPQIVEVDATGTRLFFVGEEFSEPLDPTEYEVLAEIPYPAQRTRKGAQ